VQNATSPRSRRRIVWLILAGLVAAVLVAGVFNAVALPGCASCHDRPGFREATAAAPHAEVDCRACHVPAGGLDRVTFGFRQTFHMIVPVTGVAVRDAAAVPDSRCLTCHRKVMTSIVATDGIRIAHETCAQGAACTDCHVATAHGKSTAWVRTYDMDRCLECHVTKAQIKCDLCHEGRRPSNRITSGTFAVTHGPQWRKTHGMGNPATCTVCHRSDACVGCHGPGLPHEANFVDTHSKYALDAKAKCDGCHDRTFCDTCHGTPMPHTPQFTRGHAKLSAENPALCKRCHGGTDCTRCHLTHIHPGGAIGGRLPKGGAR